jgi:hypothetical protein
LATRKAAKHRVMQLIETLKDPEDAYVVRSRLDRSLLVVRRYLAGAEGPADVRPIESMLVDIEAAFASLRRRSEPFGEAWIAKLEDTNANLLELHTALDSET